MAGSLHPGRFAYKFALDSGVPFHYMLAMELDCSAFNRA
jgi:hypothetical protein